MIPTIDINIPLKLLGNATYATMSSAKEVLSLSWDPKELQEFFFLYAQNTEAANLKARNLVQAKIDSQLAVHYDQYPIIPDFVDSDEEYGAYSLNDIHAPPKVSLEIKETKPAKKAKSSRKSEKTKKRALKKELLRVLDEPVPAFDSAQVKKSVDEAQAPALVVKSPAHEKQLITAEEVHDIVAKSDEAVDFEIGLTESRAPAAISTIQIARHSIFAIVQKFKSTFVGPLPLPALPSLEKLQLDFAFWYNLSMAQKIERPLGFELVHTGLSANASIDRSSNELHTQSPSLFPLIAQALREYASVSKFSESVPSVVDTKLIEPPKKEAKLIMPSKVVTKAGPSNATKKYKDRMLRVEFIRPSTTKKARRQRRKRTRSKKAKKTKKAAPALYLKSQSKSKVTAAIDNFEHIVKAETPKVPEKSTAFEVSLPELSDEAESDAGIIEVDDLPIFYDVDDIEDVKAEGLQVGQLSMYHHFMKLLRLVELFVPTECSEESNNLQVGQLSPYHYFMKLIKLAEDYYCRKGLSDMRRTVEYFHSLGPCRVILSGVTIILPTNNPCAPLSTSEEPSSSEKSDISPRIEESDSFSQNSPKSDDEKVSSEEVEANETSDSTPVSSPECKPIKRRFSKKPSFPRKAKRVPIGQNATHVGLTSNAKHRRQRAKKAQRNREFFNASSETPEV